MEDIQGIYSVYTVYYTYRVTPQKVIHSVVFLKSVVVKLLKRPGHVCPKASFFNKWPINDERICNRVSQKNIFFEFRFGGRITGANGCPEATKKISAL